MKKIAILGHTDVGATVARYLADNIIASEIIDPSFNEEVKRRPDPDFKMTKEMITKLNAPFIRPNRAERRRQAKNRR